MSAACSKVEFSEIPIPEASLATKMSYTEVVAAGNKQVDFLIVLDDSNSMQPELDKLAAKMGSFINSIESSNIDWQMCLTVTRNAGTGWGSPLNWKGYAPKSGVPAYLLKKGSVNLDSIFNSTISQVTIGGTGSGDERALKSTYENFTLGNPNKGSSHLCYRLGAALSVITISDEDERSVGGNPAMLKPTDASEAYQAFEREDVPENLVAHAKNIFGDDLRLTFNSIIVKPGDLACEKAQDQDKSPSHPGHVYSQMSTLTEGGVGSICDTDYSANLNTFKDKIVNSLNHLTLRCPPIVNTLKVKVNGAQVTNFKVESAVLKFQQSLVEGTKIDLNFDCK